jgi:hypothetical protein
MNRGDTMLRQIACVRQNQTQARGCSWFYIFQGNYA